MSSSCAVRGITSRCIRSLPRRTFPQELPPALRQSSRHQSRTFSVSRSHELQVQAKRSIIRQRIRALEESRRKFSTTPQQRHGHLDPPKPGQERHVTFIDKDGDEHTFEVADGDNLLDIAQANDLEMEGACGGSCACSTCHVIVQDEDIYDKIEEATDDVSRPCAELWIMR